jgi:hypothetical protein
MRWIRESIVSIRFFPGIGSLRRSSTFTGLPPASASRSSLPVGPAELFEAGLDAVPADDVIALVAQRRQLLSCP